MRQWWERTRERPVVAHGFVAFKRYTSRLGPQFAGAITYFSVLSMVPILLFSFALLGLTVTVLRPDLMDVITTMIASALSNNAFPDELSESILSLVVGALQGWSSVGFVSLVAAAYAGSRWAGNLKRAFRVMWSEKFSDAATKRFFLWEQLINLGIFLGLLLAIGFSIGVAWVGQAFSHQVIAWLGWDGIPGISVMFRLTSLLLTFLASWLLFVFLFLVLPNQPVRPKVWLIGTLVGALGVTVLQSVAGLVVGIFSGNATATIFGPMIVLMLVFNLIASITLIVAAWVGTDEVWEAERARELADEAAQAEAVAALAAYAAAEQDDRVAGRRSADRLRDPSEPLPEIGPDSYIRQDYAARGMKVNLGVGWLVGAATGLGLGALIVGGVKDLFRRR